MRKVKEEYKVLVKFMSEEASNLNPLKLTKSLSEMVGNTESAKMLRDGKIIPFCKDSKQQKAALGIKSIKIGGGGLVENVRIDSVVWRL